MVPICFIILMLLGIFLVIFSVRVLRSNTEHSVFKLPGLKMELSGPAWLICAAMGIIMIASPLIAAAMQKAPNATAPPPPDSVKRVQSIKDPTYESFIFLRDVGFLDLRTMSMTPWYTTIPGWQLLNKKSRMKPAIFKNYMLVKKTGPIDTIKFKYATTGKLDIRCPTHKATYYTSDEIENGVTTESWEVVADVSAEPIGKEFEIFVEATYWNAFRGNDGDNFTTYSHDRQEGDGEELSLIIQFPDDKPFKTMDILEIDGKAQQPTPTQIQETNRTWKSANNEAYYFTVFTKRPKMYYQFNWTW